MSILLVRPGRTLTGSFTVPGDKAIAHRALLLGAIAHGRTVIGGLPPGQDVASTAHALRAYGVRVAVDGDRAVVEGRGLESWSAPTGPVDCGNSGTTMRILAGLAARCPFTSVLDGDASLRRRPMDRVAEPLRSLGARVEARDGRFPPLRVHGGDLRGTEIVPSAPSGQVKSAILLAGLGAAGSTAVVEPTPTRDDTERMLRALGAPVRTDAVGDGGIRVEVQPFEPDGFEIEVPGDPSSAAYLIAAAVLCGEIEIPGVCLNPTRSGFLDVVTAMGAELASVGGSERMGEPVGRVRAAKAPLRAVRLDGPFPRLVDEIPLVAVLATQAHAETVITGAAELRVKESDRIAALCDGLGRMGARIEELEDGMRIEGPSTLMGAEVKSWGDHRVALALAVAGLVASGETRILGYEAAGISWPGFEDTLTLAGADMEVVQG